MVLTACGGSDRESPTSEAALQNGPVVTVEETMLTNLAVLTLGEPDIEVGADDGGVPGGYVAQVADATLDSNGGIIVADRKTNRVIRFDHNGDYVGQIAREGDGPGEFRLIGRIASTHDSVSVHDLARGVISRIPLGGGEPRETRSLPGVTTDRNRTSKPRNGRILWLGDYVPSRDYSGDYYEELLLADTTITEVVVVYGDSLKSFGRFNGGRSALVSVLPMERYDSLLSVGADFFVRAIVPLPLATGATADLLDDGVVIGFPNASELRIFDAQSRLVRTIRFDLPWAHVGALAHDLYEWMALDVPPKFRELMKRGGERFGLPDPLPFFSSVRTGEDGAVWLSTGAGPGGMWTPGSVTWLRLSPPGEPLAYVVVPSSVTVLEFHADRLLGLIRDSLEVESVVTLPIRSP